MVPMAITAMIRHIRAKALEQRVGNAGEETDSPLSQGINEFRDDYHTRSFQTQVLEL